MENTTETSNTTETQNAETSKRFDYIQYDETAKQQQEELKAAFATVEGFVSKLEAGREKSLVLTKLEEAYMWTGKAIRDSQIKRGGNSTHIAERTAE